VALGKEAVVIVGTATEGAALMVKLTALVAACDLASVTFTVKLLVPGPVGVPEIAPVLGANTRPAGKVPETIDQVYGVVPPEAASEAL